jgi:F0F1-type ATP synthase membrane subunit b/b'
MARAANEAAPNSPTPEHVKDSLKAIEECYGDLATERGKYMQKCKKIRESMSDEYDSAAKRGISKKLLKKIVKERELDRKIEALTADLEEDERSEMDMLMEKLGDFANTPLGKAAQAAMASAPGNGAQAAAGA